MAFQSEAVSSEAQMDISTPTSEVNPLPISQNEKTEYEKLKVMYYGKSLNECFALMHLSSSRELKSVREELFGVRKRVDDQESYAENVEQSLKDINEVSIVNMEQAIDNESHEREKLEQWGRKWNVVFNGIDGDLKENPRDTDSKVRMFMVDSLKFESRKVEQMLFQAVNMLPSGDPKKRGIIVRFNNLLDRDDILMAARKLPKGCGFSVIPDLNPAANKLRKKLLADLRAMSPNERKQNKLVYIKEHPFVAISKKRN